MTHGRDQPADVGNELFVGLVELRVDVIVEILHVINDGSVGRTADQRVPQL